jgi:hypothetical protein
MGRGQRRGHLLGDADRPGRFERGLIPDHPVQRPAGHELHHQVGQLAVRPEVVHGNDVRVRQDRRGLGLPPEPRKEPGVGGQAVPQHLHGHPPT